MKREYRRFLVFLLVFVLLFALLLHWRGRKRGRPETIRPPNRPPAYHPVASPAAATPLSAGPALAIVIDDIGNTLEPLEQLLTNPLPLTFAIIPGTSQGAAAAKLLSRREREYLVHLPLEPLKRTKLEEPGTLTVQLPLEQVRRRAGQALDEFPEAIGLNNHMGSRFTRDLPRMRTLLAVLQERQLFFLDSRTISPNALDLLEKEFPHRVLRRDIFLDNQRSESAILAQIKTACRRALTRDTIAIGHPYHETIQALASFAANPAEPCKTSYLSKFNIN